MQHSFKPGRKNWLDAMLGIDDEQITLSIRDNGKDFDPVNYLNNLESDDPVKGIGIKIVSGMSDSFEHQRGIGLNTTVITIKR